MNSGLRVKVNHSGAKHIMVEASGFLSGDTAITLLTLASLDPQPKSLRIDAITFSLQEKLGLCLKWGMKGEEEPRVIIPLESRGKFDFSAIGGLKPPADWEGTIILQSFNFSIPPLSERKAVLLILEMERT
jgi:hypothetical protein